MAQRGSVRGNGVDSGPVLGNCQQRIAFGLFEYLYRVGAAPTEIYLFLGIQAGLR